MGAFDPMFGDIDKTMPGRPYVVGSDGWGWFMLIILATIPFILLSVIVSSIAEFITNHLILCLCTYLLLSFGLGVVLYKNKRVKYRKLGIMATVITMVPIAFTQIAYAIPYILSEPGFDAVFDFILMLVLSVGGSIFVFSMSHLLKNGASHLAMALILLGLSMYINVY